MKVTLNSYILCKEEIKDWRKLEHFKSVPGHKNVEI